MPLLNTKERDWLARKSFLSYYNRTWIVWRNKQPYLDLARGLYSVVKVRRSLRGLPPPDEQRFYPVLFQSLINFRPFKKLVKTKFIYNTSQSILGKLPIVAGYFAKLIIDKDWKEITK